MEFILYNEALNSSGATYNRNQNRFGKKLEKFGRQADCVPSKELIQPRIRSRSRVSSVLTVSYVFRGSTLVSRTWFRGDALNGAQRVPESLSPFFPEYLSMSSRSSRKKPHMTHLGRQLRWKLSVEFVAQAEPGRECDYR